MPAIRVNNVSKGYRLVKQRPFLAKEFLRRILQRPSSSSYFMALKDVSFEVPKGESLAVIGTNGSGKSTLLSLIAQTSYPNQGTIEVRGRIGPLLELGAGFHPDLTGHENIYLNASLLGLSREEIDAKFDAIVDYADIGEFLDAPIATYSTGMQARLGFAVLAHIDPDVLIVDEALSVGDGGFRQKCEKTMRELLDKGTTLFLVSHDMSQVRDLCTRALWLHKGEVRMLGPTDEVVHEYLNTWLIHTAEAEAPVDGKEG
jgi:homopolymeric O-antigen transport system ATP-binding protein